MTDYITVVSGLPRTGTSLMCSMLEAGGMTVIKDDKRKPDRHNPKGYFEYSLLENKILDFTILNDAPGNVIKIIVVLTKHLPNTYEYRVVFMTRDPKEVLESFKKMIADLHLGRPQGIGLEIATKRFLERYDNESTRKWLGEQPNINILDVNYNELLKDSKPILADINVFLGSKLDVAKMAEMIDPKLYRNKAVTV